MAEEETVIETVNPAESLKQSLLGGGPLASPQLLENTPTPVQIRKEEPIAPVPVPITPAARGNTNVYKFKVNGEDVEKSLTDDEFQALAQKGIGLDKTVSQQDFELKTQQSQIQQLMNQNQQLQGDARLGSDVRILQEKFPEIYSQADTFIKQKVLEKNQPQITEKSKRITSLKERFKEFKKEQPDADVSLIEDVINVLEMEDGSKERFSGHQNQIDTLQNQITNQQQFIETQRQSEIQQQGTQRLNVLKNLAKENKIELNFQGPEFDRIVKLVGAGEAVEDAFRFVYGVGAPDTKAPNKGKQVQESRQPASQEKVPMFMQPRSNISQNAGGQLSEEDIKLREEIYGKGFASTKVKMKSLGRY